ncbi:MAG: hypothetical protein ACOYEV_03505 [Candidatus Nanopelagicales bacterium]
MSTSTVPAAPPSPLQSILREVRAGAGGAGEVARRTGLGVDMVEAGLATLAATGRIRRVLVFASCTPSGCGGCPSATGCGTKGSPVSASELSAWRAV